MNLSSITIALVLAFGAAVTSQAAGVDGLFRDDVRVVTQLRDIDPGVLSSLKRRFRSDRRLADRGAEFSAGDAMLPGYNPPSRRLVLAVELPDTWFVHYEHGGVGRHSHLVAFVRSGRGWRLDYAGVAFYEYRTLEKLRAAIRSHRFRGAGDEL